MLILRVLLCVFVMSAALPVAAEEAKERDFSEYFEISRKDDKLLGFFWGEDHYRNPGYEAKLHDPKTYQPHQYQGKRFDLVGTGFQAAHMIEDMMNHDIIRELTDEKDQPVVVVGPIFYQLSPLDQQRFMHVIDDEYQVVARAGFMYLADWHTDRFIGRFTRSGLQLY